MKIYRRDTGSYEEEQEFQAGLLRILYETVPGRVLLKAAIHPAASRLYALYQHAPLSRKKIEGFAAQNGIDLSGWNVDSFESFNDFFTRRRVNHTYAAADELVAVADSRLTAYPVSEDLRLRIKRSEYTLREIVGEDIPLAPFAGGTCLVFRLAVQDYHRYVFPDNGEAVKTVSIPGVLHTVRAISENERVYARNHRVCTLLETEHFGPMLQVEVGAVMVGKIHNHPIRQFSRLQEKGYFEFGGSTILLLVPQSIAIDADILEKTREGVETKVTLGEKIGKREVNKPC